MKYKVGDVVKIRSWEAMLNDDDTLIGNWGSIYHKELPSMFLKRMFVLCGRKYTIENVENSYYELQGHMDFCIEDWMIDTENEIKSSEVEHTKDIKNGDLVMAGYNNENLPYFDSVFFVGENPTADESSYITSDEEGHLDSYDLILPIERYKEMMQAINEVTRSIKIEYFNKYGLGDIE